jgi:hypothetical protein
MKIHLFFVLILCCVVQLNFAQYKSFSFSAQGDTINIIDSKGLKQGKWVITVGELRGEPGYVEEGIYAKDKKEGYWRRYSIEGDLLSVENYKYGGKDGIQQYFSFIGSLEKEESWHSYNPDAPYDTIPVYGPDNNDIIEFKIVKATQYSVPHGDWKFYEPGSGRIYKVEKYDRGQLVKDKPKEQPEVAATPEKPKVKEKPKEVLDYEKKYSGKKKSHMERIGKTSL